MSELRGYILKKEEEVLSGSVIGMEDGCRLMSAMGTDLMFLFASANRIREMTGGSKVHLCGIVNAKSGACSEDCIFCSQSARHTTGVAAYNLMDPEAMLEASRTAAQAGASCFGIVAAWRGIKKGAVLDSICEALRIITSDGKVSPHLSLGLMEDPEVAEMLAAAGAREYNINLESGPGFYSRICTTHTYEERLRTVQLARAAGMRLCCGGIFGLGESIRDRVELALELRRLDVDTVPLNFYHHQAGNKVDVDRVGALSPLEALKIAAVFRFVLPGVVLKIAGGRETILGEFQSMMFFTGVNSCMVGNYLTTAGRNPDMDLALVRQSELKL